MLAALQLLAVVAGARSVLSAPTKVEERQAPQGVPDFVLKYGECTFPPPSNLVLVLGRSGHGHLVRQQVLDSDRQPRLPPSYILRISNNA